MGALPHIMALQQKRVREYAAAFNEYYSLVYSSVYSKLNDPSDTEDICQEIFLRYFKQFESVHNHRSWLYGTMLNVLREYFRKKRGNSTDSEDEIDGISVSYVNGFRDTRILLQDAMEDLEISGESSDRTIFELVSVSNFTYKEAAEHLGMGEQQVRYRFERSVKRLLQYLRERGIQNLEDLL